MQKRLGGWSDLFASCLTSGPAGFIIDMCVSGVLAIILLPVGTVMIMTVEGGLDIPSLFCV